MANLPQDGFSSYDKDGVMTTILNIAYHCVASEPELAALLKFIGVLGSWQIPISLMEGFQFPNTDSSNAVGEDVTSLKRVLRDPNYLRLALRRLAKLCLIKLKEDCARIKGFTIHRVMCQWCVEQVTAAGKHDYIIQAAYGLAKDIFDPVATRFASFFSSPFFLRSITITASPPRLDPMFCASHFPYDISVQHTLSSVNSAVRKLELTVLRQ